VKRSKGFLEQKKEYINGGYSGLRLVSLKRSIEFLAQRREYIKRSGLRLLGVGFYEDFS
jgi:hypothetical protein